MTNKLSLPHVTRVEVIDPTGRAFSQRYSVAGASVAVQDEGRTLKVFAAETQEPAGSELPTREELTKVIMAAVDRGRELLDNPEYGGSIEDCIAVDVLAHLRTRKA